MARLKKIMQLQKFMSNQKQHIVVERIHRNVFGVTGYQNKEKLMWNNSLYNTPY